MAEFWDAAILAFAGFALGFFAQFLLGYIGMPRRYHRYPPEFQIYKLYLGGGDKVVHSRPAADFAPAGAP